MSHELVIDRQGRAAFCYNHRNGNPWHRLGHRFDRAFTLTEALALSGFDRLGYFAPVFVNDGGRIVPIEHRQAIMFPDENGIAKPTEVVSLDYKMVQYRSLAELAIAIVGGSEDAALLDTLGLLYEGRQGFGFIDFGDVETELPNGAVDLTFKGLGFLGSMDASMSSTFYTTRIRAVCNNTVTFGIASAQNILRIPHVGDQEEKMRAARQVLQLQRRGQDQFEQIMMQLGSVRGGDDVLDKVIDKVWEAPVPEHVLPKRTQVMRANRRERIHQLYREPSNAGGFGDTGWSVYNTVVEFLDHVEGDATVRARQVIDPSKGKQAKKELASNLLLAGV